ncbi:MAG: Hsp70 family protein [Endozoicomonadaceae bacterium]|nr:Hsp70 family protein [Endozoicomonadaceae bacterium]
MGNKNILIGIDLGTTNSAVTVNDKGKYITVKNQLNDEYTPSVFGIDKRKNKIVGKKAYERLYRDTSNEEVENNKAEIKRIMGVKDKIDFPRLGESFSPEEVSSEILKVLRADVIRKYSDVDASSAVITIPAAFSTLQAEATKKAGELAGFDYVILLQEPIAAALTYGFDSEDDGNWLIYDLGGGTFDVAVISSNGGHLSVLGHAGNNFLGGKDFDGVIVDKIIVPKILEEYKLNNLNRNNSKYRELFAKLKFQAEEAKIQLSQLDNAYIEIDNIGTDDNDKDIYLSFDISRKEFEEIIKPLINESITLTNQSIKDAGLDKSSISKIILIGGPTQIPLVRSSLESELGIKVDTSQDPLTAVSKGACLYGLMQKVPDGIIKELPTAHEAIEASLTYEALTSDLEEVVSGKIDKLKDAKEEEFFLQIQSESGNYSSNKIDVKGGKFIATVALDKNKQNTFWLHLTDQKGNQTKILPESFSIIHGVSVQSAPINNSIRIVISERSDEGEFKNVDKAMLFFEKGSSLPLGDTKKFKSVKKLISGEGKDNRLPIKIMEGESDTPDRNRLICELSIKGKDLPYDLSEGEPIDVTLNFSESRELTVTAYVPLIDLRVDARATFNSENININDLQNDFNIQQQRFNTMEQNLSDEVRRDIKIRNEAIQKSIANAPNDEDAKRKAEHDLTELKNTIDNETKDVTIDEYEKEYKQLFKDAEKFLTLIDPTEKQIYEQELVNIKKDSSRALKLADIDAMRRINEELSRLNIRMIAATPAGIYALLEQLVNNEPELSESEKVQDYMRQANKALEQDNLDEIREIFKKILEISHQSPEDKEHTITSAGIKV